MFSNPNSSQTLTSTADSPLHLYGAPKMSPAYSAPTTPLNVSPTSPRNPNMLPQLPLSTRQIRPPKSPMYVPAVLRPTERPYRPSPLTPPRSIHGSTDSLEGDGPTHSRTSSRTSTSDSKNKGILGKGIEEEPISENPLREVTGLPTREHWKPDANATICDAPICQKSFSLFERRHHCRHCGHVFCSIHSHFSIPLDQAAEFHPQGAESRACKHCWEQYQRWRRERSSRQNSISSGSATVPCTPIVGAARGGSEGPKAPLAASVPKDWNWSTF
ncbi:hypothetical protein MMC13_004193 [Lambiella insularis]|nr:hypothetical protein [Lambiella insularis]